MLHISDIPRYEALGEKAKKYRNLDPAASEAFMVLLHTGDRLKVRTEQWLANEGMGHARFLVLVLLNRDSSVPLSSTELSARLGVTKQTMTSLIDSLQKDDMVDRLASQEDRRVTHIRITSKGIDAVERIAPKAFDAHKQAMAALSSEEQQTLTALLRKLWGSLEPERATS